MANPRKQHGATGPLTPNVLEHAVMVQEHDSELVKACLSMVVPVKLSRLLHAMKVHVQPGLIGQAGMNALKNVTVVFNHALASVKTERKVIVPVQQLMNNNAIDNLVNAKWSIGIIVSHPQIVGPLSTSNIYPLVKQYWNDVLRTAYHFLVASQSLLLGWNISILTIHQHIDAILTAMTSPIRWTVGELQIKAIRRR